jgi:uncharacterized iron-regulated protein
MKFSLLLLLALLPFLAPAQITEHYKIYDTKNQKIISLDGLVDNLADVDVVFFGEEHNDSIGHILELELFKKMHIVYRKTALTMEMFHTDVQPVLDEYLGGYISEKNFIKEARAWNNYKDYSPLIEYAKANKLNVIGGNVATRYSNMVTRSGLLSLNTLPKASKAFLPPLPIDTAIGKYYDNFNETMGKHVMGMGGMKIYQAQNLWDASMSWTIFRYLKKHKGNKLLQLNGRFHSDEHLGALAKLKIRSPKLNIVNISCFPDKEFDNPEWNKHKHLGDYVIITDPGVKKSY